MPDIKSLQWFNSTFFAVVHGNWGSWSSWEPCSVPCGMGETWRRRVCDNPAPLNGGLYCGGESVEIRICDNEECPKQQPGNDRNFGHGNYSNTSRITAKEASSETACKLDSVNEYIGLSDRRVLSGQRCRDNVYPRGPCTKEIDIQSLFETTGFISSFYLRFPRCSQW